MRSIPLAVTAAFSLLVAVPAAAHDAEEGTGQLGKVAFANS
jgi:hypothetical protein